MKYENPFSDEDMKAFNEHFNRKREFYNDCEEAQWLMIRMKGIAESYSLSGKYDELYSDKEWNDIKEEHDKLMSDYYNKKGWDNGE